MNRQVAQLLASGLILAFLAGCGRGDATQTATASPAQAEATDLKMPPPEGVEAPPKPSKPHVISRGEKVDLASHVSAGQTTVFDFTSEYCGPCRQIAPYLDKLHATRGDVQVVKVDINRPGKRGIDWGSPVARQYGLNSIPHMKVYDEDGNLVAEGDPAWKMIAGWITEILQAERQAAGSK